jgi:hypothetical protein
VSTLVVPLAPNDPAQAALSQAISFELAQGSSLHSRTASEAWLIRPQPQVNHVVWVLLTIFTFGIAAIGWLIAVAAQPAAPTVHLWIDPYTGCVYSKTHWKR